MKSRIAVLASGGGSNLQAIVDHLEQLGARRGGEVVLVASDRSRSGALERAARRDIPVAVLASTKEPGEGGAELDGLLVQHQVARVAADPARAPGLDRPDGWPGLVYYRLHGSPRKYWSVYEQARLAQWARDLKQLPRSTQAWCVFDNTAASGALPNALQVQQLLA